MQNSENYELDPNFAVVCSFLQKFAKYFGDKYDQLSIEDLKEFLVAEQVEDNDVLVQLHIRLLRGIGERTRPDNWHKLLIKFCKDFPDGDDKRITEDGYNNMPVSAKLRILKNLMEDSFEYNDKFNRRVNEELESGVNIRHEPIGKDKLGRSYWYMQDIDFGIRLFRGLRNNLTNEETWDVVCSELDELKDLIETLEGSNELKEEDDTVDIQSGMPAVKKISHKDLVSSAKKDACNILTSPHAFKAPKKRTDTQIRQDEDKHNLPHCDVKLTRLSQQTVDKYARTDNEKEEKDNGEVRSKSTVDINVDRDKTGMMREKSPIKNDLFSNLKEEGSVSNKDNDGSMSTVEQHRTGTSQNKIYKTQKYGKKRQIKLRHEKQDKKEDDRSFAKHELTEGPVVMKKGENERMVEDKGDNNERMVEDKSDNNERIIEDKGDKNERMVEDKGDKNEKMVEDKGDKNERMVEDKGDKNERTLEDKGDKNERTVEDKGDKNERTVEDKGYKNERMVEDKGDISDDDCVIVEKEVEVISLLDSDGEDGNSDSGGIVCQAEINNSDTDSCVDNRESSALDSESIQSSPGGSHYNVKSLTKSGENVDQSESRVCSSPESGNHIEENTNDSNDVTVDSKSENKQKEDEGKLEKDTHNQVPVINRKVDADNVEKPIDNIKDIDIEHSINHEVIPDKQKHKCVELDSDQSDDERKVFDNAIQDLLQLERKAVNGSKYQEKEDRFNYAIIPGKLLERKDEESMKEKVDKDSDSDHSIDNDKKVIDNALKNLTQLEEMISQESPAGSRMSPVPLTDLSSTKTNANVSLRSNSSKLFDRDSIHTEASSVNTKFNEGKSVQDSKSHYNCRSKSFVSEDDVCPADHSDMSSETGENLAESEIPKIEKCQSYKNNVNKELNRSKRKDVKKDCELSTEEQDVDVPDDIEDKQSESSTESRLHDKGKDTEVVITGDLNNSLACQDKMAINEHSELAWQDNNTDNGKINDELCSVKERIFKHLMKGLKGDAEESEKREVNVKKNNLNTINTKPDPCNVYKQEEIPVNEFLAKVMDMIEDTSITKTEDKIGNEVKFAADKHCTVDQGSSEFKMSTIQGGENIDKNSLTDIKSEERYKCMTNGMKSDSDTSIGYRKQEKVIYKGLQLGQKDKRVTKKESVAMMVGDEMIRIEVAGDSSDGETDTANSNTESASDAEECSQTGGSPVIHDSATGNVNIMTPEAKLQQSPFLAEHGLTKVSNNVQDKVLEYLKDKLLKNQTTQTTKEVATPMHGPNSRVGRSVNMQNVLLLAPNNNLNGPTNIQSHIVGQTAPLISVNSRSQPSSSVADLLRNVYVPRVTLLSTSNTIPHASIPQPLTINLRPTCTAPVVSTSAKIINFPVLPNFGMMLATSVQAQSPALPFMPTSMPRIVYAPGPSAPLINVKHAMTVLTNSNQVVTKASNVMKRLDPANSSFQSLNIALNTIEPNKAKQNSMRNADSAKPILPQLAKKKVRKTMTIVIGKDGVHYNTDTGKPYFPHPDKKKFVVAGPQGKFYDKATGFEVDIPNSASLIHTQGAVYHISGATFSERVVRDLAAKQWNIKKSKTSATSDIKGSTASDLNRKKPKSKKKPVIIDSSDEEFEKLLEAETEKSESEESEDPNYDYDKISQRIKAVWEKKIPDRRISVESKSNEDDAIEIDIDQVPVVLGRNAKRAAVRKRVNYLEDKSLVVVSDSEEEEADVIDDTNPCKVCNTNEEPFNILLCDKCDSCYHMSCLSPPLSLVPLEDWFCPQCEHDLLIEVLKTKFEKARKARTIIRRNTLFRTDRISTATFRINSENIVGFERRSCRRRKDVSYNEAAVKDGVKKRADSSDSSDTESATQTSKQEQPKKGVGKKRSGKRKHEITRKSSRLRNSCNNKNKKRKLTSLEEEDSAHTDSGSDYVQQISENEKTVSSESDSSESEEDAAPDQEDVAIGGVYVTSSGRKTKNVSYTEKK